LSKPGTHIPTTLQCDTCHKIFTAFNPATMNHTGTANLCTTCHSGQYVSQNALTKPINHIPHETQLLAGATMNCDKCHTSTTLWSTQTMNHNASMGNGSGWCKGCHQTGMNFLASLQKKSLTHNKSTGVTDCSQSGCHRPLGNRGTAYKSW
jgi:predicted CXXCH cytochrome family protein